jgi:hypothetical protein
MTRKHYRMIAAALSELALVNPTGARDCALKLAQSFERDNPRFDAGRFLEACRARS